MPMLATVSLTTNMVHFPPFQFLQVNEYPNQRLTERLCTSTRHVCIRSGKTEFPMYDSAFKAPLTYPNLHQLSKGVVPVVESFSRRKSIILGHHFLSDMLWRVRFLPCGPFRKSSLWPLGTSLLWICDLAYCRFSAPSASWYMQYNALIWLFAQVFSVNRNIGDRWKTGLGSQFQWLLKRTWASRVWTERDIGSTRFILLWAIIQISQAEEC